MNDIQIIGRSSSHFTRVTLMFAHQLAVPFELVPIYDMTQVDAAAYAGNPALKLPTLRYAGGLVFGAENICRTLAELAPAPAAIIWPEQLRQPLARNAQELVWHGMAAQVQLVLGTVICKLPADNVYFTKALTGFEAALQWLDEHLGEVRKLLPAPRDLSLFEVTLFCLIEHLVFRPTLPIDAYPALLKFSEEFGTRPAAQRTRYQVDKPPVA